MRIILVSPVPPPAGGIATWTKMYLNSEFARRHDIYLVNTAVCGKRVQDLSQKSLLDEIKRTIKILKELKSKLKKHADIVHINSPCSKTGLIRDYFCARLVKKVNCNLIFHFRCDTSFMVNNAISLKYFKKICALADEILVLNSPSKEFVKFHTGKESYFIPNFVHEDVMKFSKQKQINKKIKKILYAGHITESKGAGLILEIAADCPEYEFNLIGYVAEEMKIKKKPDNVNFLFEQPHENVLNVMKECDVFLFPSHSEGFPNVISEAMGMGMPIIATSVGAIPDMLEDKGGILIPVNDKRACKIALKTLEDQQIRLDMSIWNQKKVTSCYMKEQVLINLESMYEQVLERGSK